MAADIPSFKNGVASGWTVTIHPNERSSSRDSSSLGYRVNGRLGLQSRYKGERIGAAMVKGRWARARESAGFWRILSFIGPATITAVLCLSKTGNLKAVIKALGHGM
jgi:hypothetical protein